MKTYYVYIVSSGTRHIYIGMTSDLGRRMNQHRSRAANSFTARYGMTSLVYYEVTNDVEAAMRREKQLKGWRRAKKLGLIDGFNPEWRDLAAELVTG